MASPDDTGDVIGGALAALQNLQLGSSTVPQNASYLEPLAERSRTDLKLREKLAAPAVLETLIMLIEMGLEDSVAETELALRCLGNACIDNDDARSEVAKSGFAWASQCLVSDRPQLVWLTVKVLYNICSDHDEAQIQCYRDRIHLPLIRLYTNRDTRNQDDVPLLIDLLFWLSGQREEVLAGAPEQIPRDVLVMIMSLSESQGTGMHTEDVAVLFEISLAYLRDSAIQDEIVEHRMLIVVWRMFQYCEKRAEEGDGEALEVLRPLSTSIMWCLSDIAANENFARRYGLNDDLISSLCSILQTGQRSSTVSSGTGDSVPGQQRSDRASDRCIAAACQIVGNLIRKLNEDIVAELVVKQRLHEELWRRLAVHEDESDHDVEHSIAGMLVQLTRPSVEARDIMGKDTHAHDALAKLCRSQAPEIKQDGIRLLRALGKDCPENQERFGELAAEAMRDNGQQDAPVLEAPA